MFSWLNTKPHISTDEEAVDALLTRGVSEVIQHESLKKKLTSGKQLRIKLGIDPTSPNIHLGRAVLLLKLRDFQQLGHHIILIVGDGTGVIGDTSDKESERPMLTTTQVQENMCSYFDQAGKVLDMRRVESVYNSSWLNKLNYEDIGEHADQFSVADFIARDNIKRRLDAGKRVSLREVLYPLMQGYDSVAVRADIELGGNDQRFNLLAGRPLQQHFGQEPQDILLMNLIDGLDGRKMSSSWGNTINVTEAPREMYAQVMSARDDVIISYFTHVTRVPMEEVEKLEQELASGSVNPRDAKMQLAREIVALFHNEDSALDAERAFVATFQKGTIPDDTPTGTAKTGELLVEVLLREGIVDSKSDFRRLVDAGAIVDKENDKKVSTHDEKVTETTYKVGKHRFIRIVCT